MSSDDLIRQLGGCSGFQFAVSTFGALTYIVSAFTMVFMSFGMYNPGWRCLDNLTTNTVIPTPETFSLQETPSTSESTNLMVNTSNDLELSSAFTDSCIGFDECTQVQFNQKESTIVTEWALICGGAWKASAIASIQMAGLTVGHFISGYVGDAFGRKLTLGINVFIEGVLTLVSVASVSWEMFAVLKFFIGVACGIVFCVANVYMTEFVTPKWHVIIPSIPMWVSGCLLLSLFAMVFKDWKYIHVVNGIFAILLVIPAFIFPESLRWLVANKKEKKSAKAVRQIAKLNKVDISGIGVLNQFFEQKDLHNIKTPKKDVGVFGIFKKSAIKNTLIFSFVLFVSNILYWSSNFGVASLPGDVYLNNVIIFSTELPANLIAWFAPNFFGRKLTGSVTLMVQGISTAIFLIFDLFTSGSVREIGVLSFIIIARNSIAVIWFVVITCTSELYPTSIRAAATGWMMFLSGLAGVISPYLVINDLVMHITYIVVSVFSLAGGFMICFIPETSGKDLPEEPVVNDSSDFHKADFYPHEGKQRSQIV